MMRKMIAILAAAFLAGPAMADDSHAHGAAAAGSSAGLADGEIRKVNKDAQKITIRHGPLPSLDMPQAMTMVYRVKDPAMLDQVKAGDKVRFVAEKQGGAYVVTRIEPAR